MARKSIPAHPSRERSRDDESLLLRSAESLGRMIGSLQRQLDIATGRLSANKSNGGSRGNSRAKSSMKAKTRATQTRAGARKKSRGGTSAARKSVKKR